MSPVQRRVVAAAVVLVSTLVPIGAAELTLRQIDRIVRPVDSGWGWAQSPLRGTVPAEWPDHTNELGLRGRSIRYDVSDFVVLLLGDSQVEAATQQPDVMPEQLLQAELSKATGRSVRVFSLGSSGWSQDQQLLAMRRYLARWRADLVVTWLTPRNDYWENTFHDRSSGRDVGPIKPTFRLVDGRLVGPSRSSGGYLTGSALGQVLWTWLQGASAPELIRREHDALLPSASRPLSTDACPDTEAYPQGRFYDLTNRIDESIRYSLLLDPRDELPEESRSHFSPLAEPRSARDEYLEGLTTALLQEIDSEAASRGIESVVFAPQVPVVLRRDALVDCYISGEGHVFRRGGGQDVLVQRTVPSGLLMAPVVDGGAELMTAPGDNHFGEIGNRRAMGALARELVARGIVPRG